MRWWEKVLNTKRSARATPSRLGASPPGRGRMRLRFRTGLSGAQYVSAQGWRDATLARCPNHPASRCSCRTRNRSSGLATRCRATLRDTDRIILADLLAEHDALDRRLADLDRQFDAGLAEHEAQRRLPQTIPGIDHAAATAILVEAGPDPAATFGAAARFAAGSGVCPGNNERAGKRRNARAKLGAKHLRGVLVGCAHGTARTKGCQFHAHHRALTVRRGHKRAIVATAHKLARTVFAVLRNGQPYRDPDADHEALVVQRNAARWLAKLGAFGILEPRDDGSLAVNWNNAWRHPRRRPPPRGHNPGLPAAGSPSPHTARFACRVPTTPPRDGRAPAPARLVAPGISRQSSRFGFRGFVAPPFATGQAPALRTGS